MNNAINSILKDHLKSEEKSSLTFHKIFSCKFITDALESDNSFQRVRVFTIDTMIWCLIHQVLSADKSCKAIVTKLIVRRISMGLKPISALTGAYCQAKKSSLVNF